MTMKIRNYIATLQRGIFQLAPLPNGAIFISHRTYFNPFAEPHRNLQHPPLQLALQEPNASLRTQFPLPHKKHGSRQPA